MTDFENPGPSDKPRLPELEERRARLSAAEAQLASGADIAADGVFASDANKKLHARRAELLEQAANYKVLYKHNHPELQKAKQELQEVGRAISTEHTRIIASLRKRSKTPKSIWHKAK